VTKLETRFEAALRRIAAYMTPAQLRRQSERKYGLTFEESLEMAYENVIGEAKAALRGVRKRRRSNEPPTPTKPAVASTSTPTHDGAANDEGTVLP